MNEILSCVNTCYHSSDEISLRVSLDDNKLSTNGKYFTSAVSPVYWILDSAQKQHQAIVSYDYVQISRKNALIFSSDKTLLRKSHDLDPIVIKSIKKDGRTLHFDPRLELVPVVDKQLIVLQDDMLNIYVYTRNRDTLMEELKVELFLLWDEYAQELPENLTPKAQKLREILLMRCREE